MKVNDKFGIVDWGMNYLLKPDFTGIRHFDGDRYIISVKEKFGLADAKGNILWPMDYTGIDNAGGGYYRVVKKDKTGLYSVDKGSVIIEPMLSDVLAPIIVNGASVIPAKNDKGLWALISPSGTNITDFKYSAIAPLSELQCLILTLNDNSQQLFFPEEKAFIGVKLDGIKEKGPFTTISGTLTRPNDLTALRIYSSLAPNGKLTRTINRQGETVSDYEYTEITQIPGGYLLLTGPLTYAIHSPEGALLHSELKGKPTRTANWMVFSDKAISPEMKKFNYSQTGELSLVSPADGSAKPQWYILENGKMSDKSYDSVHLFGFADIYMTEKDGKHGVLTAYKEIIPCISESKISYLPGPELLVTLENGKSIYYDMNGRIVWDKPVDDILFFASNDCYMTINGKTGLYYYSPDDHTLQEVAPCVYDMISLINEECALFWVQKGDLYGVIDTDGKIVIPVEYTQPNLHFYDTYFCGTKGGKNTYYRLNGEIIPAKREVTVTKQYLEHNIYHNGVKGFKLHYNFDTRFLNKNNESIYVTAAIYKSNGQPAKDRSGKHITCSSWKRPSYTFATFTDQQMFFPYSNIVQGKGTQEYYIVLTFRDESGAKQIIPTTGNNKLTFTLTR